MNVEFYAAAAAALSYRRQALSIWARVPVRQKGDDTNSGLSAFIPAALDEVGKHGITRLPKTIRAIWAETADDGVVRRLIRDERYAYRKAEKVFRLIERECPLSLRRFSKQELWEAIYLGHRQNARGVPILPDMPGFDIREYLCGETIVRVSMFIGISPKDDRMATGGSTEAAIKYCYELDRYSSFVA